MIYISREISFPHRKILQMIIKIMKEVLDLLNNNMKTKWLEVSNFRHFKQHLLLLQWTEGVDLHKCKELLLHIIMVQGVELDKVIQEWFNRIILDHQLMIIMNLCTMMKEMMKWNMNIFCNKVEIKNNQQERILIKILEVTQIMLKILKKKSWDR